MPDTIQRRRENLRSRPTRSESEMIQPGYKLHHEIDWTGTASANQGMPVLTANDDRTISRRPRGSGRRNSRLHKPSEMS
jgi:hypothetical protein